MSGAPTCVSEPTGEAAAALHRGNADVTVIEPKRGWQAIDFRELRRYHELLYFLIWRDVKVRYKQTVIGAAWAILQPVVTMVVLSVVFGRLLGLSFPNVPYAIGLYVGLLPWTFFASSVSQSGVSLVNQAHLLTKIYFPRIYVPTATIGAGLIDFALGFCVYLGIFAVYFRLGRIEQLPGMLILMIPVLVLVTIVTALGVGYLLASLTVTYRDFRFVIPFMIQIWFFASPVILPAARFENIALFQAHPWILAVNPMTGIIQGFRAAMLNLPMNWSALAMSAIIGVTVFVFGLYNFRRTERRFADIA